MNPLYDYNKCFVRKYNDTTYKLVMLSCVRARGYDLDQPRHGKGEVNDFKLSNNLQRSKSKILELALCNPWEFFVTFTLSPEKYNRHDLSKFKKDLGQFISDYNKRNKIGDHVKYLFIPEVHKDGTWHMHGLIYGISECVLHKFTLSEKIPHGILNMIKKGTDVFKWQAYENKFGWNTMTKVKDSKACSFYITKYLTKEVLSSVQELSKHSYLVSHGLKRSEVIAEGYLNQDYVHDFEGPYATVDWFEDKEDALSRIEPFDFDGYRQLRDRQRVRLAKSRKWIHELMKKRFETGEWIECKYYWNRIPFIVDVKVNV